MGCDAAKNYMSLEIHNWLSGWNIIWGSSQELYVYTGASLNNLIQDNIIGLKIQK